MQYFHMGEYLSTSSTTVAPQQACEMTHKPFHKPDKEQCILNLKIKI